MRPPGRLRQNSLMQRVLFFAEGVTLAHVARPSVIAAGLDVDAHDWVIACPPRQVRFLPGAPHRHLPLASIESDQFLRALAHGRPVYTLTTLRHYVQEDLALIERVRPDVVVGDFRLSLSVSARLVGVPYINVTNAYWSPYYTHPEFPLPVLPMTRFLPIAVAGAMFRIAGPIALQHHCQPMNRLRRENGQPEFGNDLRRIYTDGDTVLFADVEELFPTPGRPPTHHYLGPLLWSPPAPEPEWWSEVPEARPIIFVTLGSSGDPRLLPRVLQALAEMDVTIIAATAGSPLPDQLPKNVLVAPYVPGIEAARRASLVVCNGGSMTTQQSLAARRPVIGIASNMDQFLNMRALEAAGLGRTVRADRLRPRELTSMASELLALAASRIRWPWVKPWPGGPPPGWPGQA